MNQEINTFLKTFVEFNDREIDEITSSFVTKRIKKGDFTLREGEVCKDLVFVKSGALRMFYFSNEIEVSAWFSLKNCISMEVHSFISGIPSICFIHAIEDSEIMLLSKEKLEMLYQTVPKSQEWMRKMWEQALVEVIPRFSSLQNESAEQRYLELLKKPEYMQQIPQKYLASYIGITPTSLSRIRKKIK